MSYILDALKKMEQEKARKIASAGMTKISGELFREDRPRSPRSGAGKLVAVALVAALAAIAGTWFFLSPSQKPALVALRTAAPPDRKVATPAALPAAPPVSPPPVAQTLPQSIPRAEPPPRAQRRISELVQPAVSPSFRAAQRREAKGRSNGRRESALPAVAPRPAPDALVAPPADIKVSGIAWADERETRRAVINGFLLKEGSVVGGARISKIMKDRVRFSQAGGNFEVSMAAPGNPAAGPAK
jgi:general secretion pathway protein B